MMYAGDEFYGDDVTSGVGPMADVSVQEIAEAEDPHRCEWCTSPRSDHYDHGGAIGHDWEPLHEWSGLDERHDECLVCGEVRFQEPDYGDWRGDA